MFDDIRDTGKPLYKAKFGIIENWLCREVGLVLVERVSFSGLTKLQ